MALPFNPMSFVTPYTAVGSGHRGGGASFANSINQAKQQKVSEGYLANTQHQTEQNDKRFGQKEVDQARERLDSSLLSGNQDAVELAANNLRAVASRYGFSLSETRSDAQLKSGVSTAVGKQEAEVGTEANPFDVDAYDAAQAKAKEPTNGSSDKVNAEADARIDAELAKEQPNPFTGGVPGGSLPAASGKTAAASVSPVRTPGGSLPAASAAEPPGASEAPLRGYTLLGADGKPLYSVAPKDIEGRQRQRVGDVFEGLASKTQDANELQWLSQAKAEAEKLVGVMPLDEAVKTGLAHYVGQMNGRDKLAMVEANHKRFGGGGGTPGLIGKNDDRAESTDKYGDNIEMALQHRGIPASEQALSQAEGALLSGDPALQKDALKIILKARSGLTVSEAERRSYSMVDGALPALSNAISQWTGEPLDEQTVRSYLSIVQNMRRANEKTQRDIIDYERRKYEAQNRRKVADPVLKERSESLDPSRPSPSVGENIERPKAGIPKKSVKDLE